MPLLGQVLGSYPKDVKLVYKNFPFRERKYARKAAIAALAAERQGKFWDFHDDLFINIDRMNDQMVQQIANDLVLDMVEFNKSLKDPKIEESVDRDIREGNRAGVKETPTIFINGRRLGDPTLEGFQVAIEKELQRAK